MFTDAFSPDHQLLRADTRHSTHLACALLLRGAVTMSDVNRNMLRLRPHMNMAHWNSEVGGGS